MTSVFAVSELQEIDRVAVSLDKLVCQKHPVAEVIHNGKREKKEILPVDLEKIVPVSARMLKIEPNDLRELLRDDKEKLSRIVFACLIAVKTNDSWPAVLKSYRGKNLMARVQELRMPLPEVQRTLDDLYTELSFVALDSPLYAQGGASDAEKGEGSKRKK